MDFFLNFFQKLLYDRSDNKIYYDKLVDMAKIRNKRMLILKSADQMEPYVFRPFEVTQVKYPMRLDGTYPTARSGHRVVCTEDNLYVFGGFNPSTSHQRFRRERDSLFREMWSFNFSSKQWKLCLNISSEGMPEEVASNAITARKHILIAYGGTGYPFGERCSNNCYIFPTDSLPSPIIQIAANGKSPTPTYGPAITVHDNYLYVIGGTTGFEYCCDVHRLNLITRNWEVLYKDMSPFGGEPTGRYRHEIVHIDNFIYILGGGTSDTSCDLENLPTFDLSLNKWTFTKTHPDLCAPAHCSSNGYPFPRKCHSCIQYEIDTPNGKVVEAIIVGGIEQNRELADVWKIDFSTFTWKRMSLSRFPHQIYFHGAGTPGNGCMYIFGGIEMHTAVVRTNKLYKMWATIPKLSEICWDALNYYVPNLCDYPKEYLFRIGIPEGFLKRLPEND